MNIFKDCEIIKETLNNSKLSENARANKRGAIVKVRY